jgi:hypothetical protein
MTQLASKQRYPCIKDIVDRRQRDLVSRDNLDENGGGTQSLKWRPVAKL